MIGKIFILPNHSWLPILARLLRLLKTMFIICNSSSYRLFGIQLFQVSFRATGIIFTLDLISNFTPPLENQRNLIQGVQSRTTSSYHQSIELQSTATPEYIVQLSVKFFNHVSPGRRITQSTSFQASTLFSISHFCIHCCFIQIILRIILSFFKPPCHRWPSYTFSCTYQFVT